MRNVFERSLNSMPQGATRPEPERRTMKDGP
jgi:hypothetical protein